MEKGAHIVPEVLKGGRFHRLSSLGIIPRGNNVPRVLIHRLSLILCRQGSWLQTHSMTMTDMSARVCGPLLTYTLCTGKNFEPVSSLTKVGTCWVDQSLLSDSLGGFHVSLYNCTSYRCCFAGLQKCGRNFNDFNIRLWLTQRGPTLRSTTILPDNINPFTWLSMSNMTSTMGRPCLCC